MKKILIIANGHNAHTFLGRLSSTYAGENHYDIISYGNSVALMENPLGFSFHHIDPTSPTRLSKVISNEHIQVNIVVEEENDVKVIYKLIRKFEKSVPINILDFWGLDIEDDYLTLVDTKELMANRLVSLLPDVPVVAQHIGLGQGEIMEIQVPVGSAYAYRHLMNIEQKKWKVAAVYRNNHILIPKPSLMIRPNDNLLAIGQPSILKNVYNAIKAEVGQFPSPYGRNAYYILDAKDKHIEDVEEELKNAVNIHKRINSKKLYIRVVRPTDVEVLSYVRNEVEENSSIEVIVAYRSFRRVKDYADDIDEFAVGVIIVTDEFFSEKLHRRMLFDSKRAVFKLAHSDVNHLESGAIILTENKNIESLSAPMFDVSSQLNIKMTLFNITPDLSGNKEVIEHFENLAVLYERKLEIIKKRGNPVREIVKHSDLLQFFPFTRELIESSIFDVFKVAKVEKQYRFLKKFHQIFIPVLEESI